MNKVKIKVFTVKKKTFSQKLLLSKLSHLVVVKKKRPRRSERASGVLT